MIRNLLLALMLGTIALGATACNTVKGFGKDIQKTGEKIEDASGK